LLYSVFYLTEPSATEISTLSLHDALPISARRNRRLRASQGPASRPGNGLAWRRVAGGADHAPGRHASCRSQTARAAQRDRGGRRSEEHTSELQSRGHLVCRLLLEKKKESV